MTESTERTIDLDRKTRAIVSGNKIAIQHFQPSGDWDAIAFLQGGGRTIQAWCAANNVYPTRDAEALLATLPDLGFKER